MTDIPSVSIRDLSSEPYASVICYPRVADKELKKRIDELRKLRVQALRFCGPKKAFNVSVLGKGYVGIVVLAYRSDTWLALKIRRIDADRPDMQHEAKMLKQANLSGIGPRLIDTSKNFLLTEFIDGSLLPEWLKRRRSSRVVQRILRKILGQCCCLDEIGIDHGELSYAAKHIIISEKQLPFIVDFESASIKRRASNVTAICQYLFLSGHVAMTVRELLGKVSEKRLIDALGRYKRDRSVQNFERILAVCCLDNVSH